MHLPSRILLLHENAELLAQMQRHLTEKSYEIRAEKTIEAALETGRHWEPHLLVVQFGVDSQATAGLIESLHQQYSHLRFIILTPPGHTLEIMRSMRNRIAAFLSQPFSMEDLMYYVRNVLNAGERGTNRREHSRYIFTLDTHCILINPFDNTESRPIPALVRDVSRSGVSIIVRQLLPVPAMLKLVLHFNDQSAPVPMLAKSISCMLTQIHGVYRVGLKFIGLLPTHLTGAVVKIGKARDGNSSDEDIYMGKSFADAVRDWLLAHQHDGLLQPDQELAELAAELCRVESEHDLPLKEQLILDSALAVSLHPAEALAASATQTRGIHHPPNGANVKPPQPS